MVSLPRIFQRAAELVGEEFNLDIENDSRWNALTENNIGLHILFVYLDLLSTLRAVLRSENDIEYRQNLAYYIMSAHEGFKKLYGFDVDKREQSFWHRSIKAVLTQEGDGSILSEVKDIEDRLESISKDSLLRDEDIVAAFTHVGYVKNLKRESSFSVLEHFMRPLDPEDSVPLTEFLYVTSDIVRLFTRILKLESSRIKRENAAKCQGYLELLGRADKMMTERVQDLDVLARWKEAAEKLRSVVERLL